MEDKTMKTWVGVIGGVMLLIIIIYGILLYVAYSKQTFIFKKYQPNYNTELYVKDKELYDTPLSPEDVEKKKNMVEAARAKLNLKKVTLGQQYNPFGL
jgi:hypothetical protein